MFAYGFWQITLLWASFSLRCLNPPWWGYTLPFFGFPLLIALVAAVCAWMLPWWRLSGFMRYFMFGMWWCFYMSVLALMNLEWVQMLELWGGLVLTFVQLAFYIGGPLANMAIITLMLASVYALHAHSVSLLKKAGLGWIALCVVGTAHLAFHPTCYTNASVGLVHTYSNMERAPVEIEKKLYCLSAMRNLAQDVQAVILPEAFFGHPPEHYQTTAAFLRSLNCPVFVGAMTQHKASVYANSMIVFSHHTPGYTNFYDKITLLPFGEYLPFARYLPNSMKAIAQGFGEIMQGIKPAVYAFAHDVHGKRLPPFLPRVCYEGAISFCCDPKVEWILNVSNERWFFSSLQEQGQFWAVLRIRAVEAGRAIVRSTNDGATGCIDPCGRTLSRITGPEAIIKQRLPEKICAQTPWMRYTALWTILYWCIIVFSVLYTQWFVYKKRKNVLGKKKSA